MGTELAQQVPVNVSGSSVFGIYPKISVEKSYNFFITDGWMCNYAGFQKVIELSLINSEGRGLFHAIRPNFMIAVVGSNVYRINTALAVMSVGTLESSTGEVFIDENLAAQIIIVDGINAYIYDYLDTQQLTKQTLTNSFTHNIIPSYAAYHNSYFLIAGGNSPQEPQNWYAYEPHPSDTTQITRVAEFQLQTKPDKALAVKRMPGAGNNVIVLGSSVGEIWTQVPSTQVYTRVSSYNIDYGCASVSTIAASEEFVAWLGQNENNAPSIMISTGNATKRISTDGIDHLLESIKRPDKSTAMFYRQNGHLFYQLTFFAPEDDLTLLYDFTTEQFFHACDEKEHFYPARQIVFFNEATYFVSLNNADLFQMGDQFLTYNYTLDDDDLDAQGEEIPRIRVCKTIRKEDSSTFRANLFTFWIEQGVNDYFSIDAGNGINCEGLLITEHTSEFIVTESGDNILAEDGFCVDGLNANRPRVDMTISKNGNQSFSNTVSRELNPQGIYKNQVRWHRLGQANELTIQLRFLGFQRFVINSGIVEIY